MRNLESSLTLLYNPRLSTSNFILYIHVPAGEGPVDSPGHSWPVGWQRCLLPSVGYRDNAQSSFLHTAIYYTCMCIHKNQWMVEYRDTKTQAGHQARCCCVSGIEWCEVEVRNLESSLTLLYNPRLSTSNFILYIHVPAGEGPVDSPGHSGPVGWQRCLHPSVGYRDNA